MATVAVHPKTPLINEGVNRFRTTRDAYGWEVGGGTFALARGTMVVGKIVRRNDIVRRVVLETDDGLLTFNEEDLETLGSIH